MGSSLPYRLVVLATWALAASLLLAPVGARAQAGSGPGFVRLEPAERGAPPNDHPALLTTSLLRDALASIRLRGARMGSVEWVFDGRDLAEIVPGLVQALARADRTQDVTFAVFGTHGTFGRYSLPTVTTGRVFVQDGRLNVILGRVQTTDEKLDTLGGGPVDLLPGQRARRVERIWQAYSDQAVLVDRRGDWLRFDLDLDRDALPRPPVAPASAASPQVREATDPRYQDLRARLQALDRLKAEGLITDEEYSERRRAILQSL